MVDLIDAFDPLEDFLDWGDGHKTYPICRDCKGKFVRTRGDRQIRCIKCIYLKSVERKKKRDSK